MKVRWDELSPGELQARLANRAVAYLPMGTLEWHGPHLPLGVDAILSGALMTLCAERYGGVALPPIHLGPDRARPDGEGGLLVGMDYDDTTTPARKLPGSAYWVSAETFEILIGAQLKQLKRAGVDAVFADGHGPSRWQFSAHLDDWSHTSGLKLFGVPKSIEAGWESQMDHAARNETSMMLAVRPDLVHLERIEGEGLPDGVAGEDPRLASAQEGRQILERTAERVDAMLRAAGF